MDHRLARKRGTKAPNTEIDLEYWVPVLDKDAVLCYDGLLSYFTLAQEMEISSHRTVMRSPENWYSRVSPHPERQCLSQPLE